MGLQKGVWMGIFILFSLLHSRFIDLQEGKNFSYDFVILTEDSLVEVFQDFVDLKWKTGVTTTIFPISYVKSNFAGSDIQEKIRNFIRYYHESGTRYFLLAADNDVIPARVLYIPISGMADDFIPSDFYYMCLDGDFNADGDSLFGEFSDSVDVSPDVVVSRLPVKSSSDVRNYLKKVRSYMFSPYPQLNRATFIGSDITTPGSGAQYCISLEDSFPAEFEKLEFFETSSHSNDKNEVLDSLSTGSGFVYGNLHAQSFDRMLINFTPRRPMTNYDVDNRLLNYDKPGFYDIVTCHIGGFDTDALAEHLILDSTGAIGVYATTRLNYPAITANLNKYFYGQLFRHGNRRMGDLDFLTRTRYANFAGSFINYRYVVFSYELFGDPTLKLWTGYPEPLRVNVSASDSLLTVEVRDSLGNPVPQATVVVYSKGSFLSTGETGDSGVAIVSIRPGGMSIFVEKDGYQNFLDTLTINYNGPVVRFFGSGFSHGVILPGDTVSVVVGITNAGGDAAGDFSVVAVSADPCVRILNGEFYVERIDPGDSILVTDSLSFVVDQSAGDMESFEIHLYCVGQDTVASDSIQGIVKRSDLSIIYMRVTGDSLMNIHVGISNDGSYGSRSFNAGILPGNYTVVDSLVEDSLGSHGIMEVSGLSIRLTDAFDSTVGIFVVDRFSSDTAWIRIGNTYSVGHVSYTPLQGGVRLTWEPVEGACGYAIFRESGGPYRLAGFTRMGWFYDSMNTVSNYRIAVVDSGGFCGEPGEEVQIYPNFPVKNGFPVYAEGGVYGSPVAGEFDTAYPGKEILIASFPYGYVYLYHSDGRIADGWPVFLGGEIWASPAMADLDGDGEDEAIVTLRSSNEVHAFNGDGSELPGWPVHTGRGTLFTPAIGDLDGDGSPEIVINDQSSDLYIFRNDGSGYLDSSGIFLNVGNWWKAGSPMIFDYDGDLINDIGVGIYTNGHLYFGVFSSSGDTLLLIPLESRIASPPVVGDFRRDLNGYEILINDNGTVKLFDHQGNLLVSDEGFRTVVAADVNFDGELDIVGTTERGVKVISSRGSVLLNMEFPGSEYYLKEPVVGDIDNDRVPEILFESLLGSRLFSVELDSSITPGFPFNLVESPGYSIPVLDDIDVDGFLDVIVASTFDSVWVLETRTPASPSRLLFPVEKYNYARTGFINFIPSGRSTDSPLKKPLLFPTVTKGTVFLTSDDTPVELTFYTVDGRVVKRFTKGVSGTLKLKLNFPTGIYFFRIKSEGRVLKTGKVILFK